MTKLMEWLSAAIVFLGIWTVMLKNPTDSVIFKENRFAVLLLPVVLVGLFGIYAASAVMYKVLTFNNCEKAAEELQLEIKLAKEDLRKKGFVFN